MIDKWKKGVGNNKVFGALLSDISKLNACGLSFPALEMIQDYLQNQIQRTKIKSSYISWEDTTPGVSQGSILRPLLFNIFLCDLFHEYQNNYFANYADDTTPYIVSDNTTEVLTNLSSFAQKLITWFANNKMKVNHDKCYLLLSTQERFNIQMANFAIKSSKAKKLLRIDLDKNLKFDIHAESIC